MAIIDNTIRRIGCVGALGQPADQYHAMPDNNTNVHCAGCWAGSAGARGQPAGVTVADKRLQPLQSGLRTPLRPQHQAYGAYTAPGPAVNALKVKVTCHPPAPPLLRP
eukprot:752283-Rhodomonas_salina.1